MDKSKFVLSLRLAIARRCMYTPVHPAARLACTFTWGWEQKNALQVPTRACTLTHERVGFCKAPPLRYDALHALRHAHSLTHIAPGLQDAQQTQTARLGKTCHDGNEVLRSRPLLPRIPKRALLAPRAWPALLRTDGTRGQHDPSAARARAHGCAVARHAAIR